MTNIENHSANATARPWHVEQSTKNPDVIWITAVGAGSLDVADLYSKGMDGSIFNKENAAANAALIVRAVNSHDDLVEALEKAANDLESMGNNVDEERAAIAKARGET